MPSSDVLIDNALRFTRYGQRLIAADPTLRNALRAGLDRPFQREEIQAFLAAQTINNEADLKRVLRTLKKHVALRLMVRDLSGIGDLTEVMASISALAELSIQEALRHLSGWHRADYGTPIGEESGTAQELIVIGMGKLGGCELNVSSDVDLIYIYPEEGQAGKLSNHEYFTKLAQKLTQAISELTADGYVFRVDLRLRPYGDSGPVVSSFAMLEQYLLTQGREWERYAWIKARALSGDAAGLEQLARPFVYRRYLDFGAFASMRDLHGQIRREVTRRALADNIKLGPGGIREIEFIAQVFQLIRGGKETDLQIRPTCAVLDLLALRGRLPQSTVAELQNAYHFLRNLEHRLQYLDDAQTHSLPENDTDRCLIASAMHFDTWENFRTAFDAHRIQVKQAFDDVFSENATPDDQTPLFVEHPALARLAELGYTDPQDAASRLSALKRCQRYTHLPEKNKVRFDRLMSQIVEAAAHHAHSNDTLARTIMLMETIAQRESYLALLAEYPQALTHVVKFCAASAWATTYLSQHPILLDELLDPRALLERCDWDRLRKNLRADLGDYTGTERQMDTLRNFKHAQTFHLLAQEMEGILSIEDLSKELTTLAECLLTEVLHIVWLSLPKKHGTAPHFAIIGYGKLGSRELNYASDLDIVFLYDDPDPAAPETYARYAQRINSWLTTFTPAGTLYETDLRLRPEGNSGLFVSSITAFSHYQQHDAWVWEHQALTRARFVAGDAAIGEAFEHIRREIICRSPDIAALRADVVGMRKKMHATHPTASTLFDLKHDQGGLIDVEFIVQFLVLAHASTYSDLADNIGNSALLSRAAQHGLVNNQRAEEVRSAYRALSSMQHRERLQDNGIRVKKSLVAPFIDSVKLLWTDLFGAY